MIVSSKSEATRLYALLRKNASRQSCASSMAHTRGRSGKSTIGDALRYVFRYAARPAPAVGN